jgi:cytochrome P450
MTTNRKFRPGPVDKGLPTWFDGSKTEYERNRMLFDWLCDWRNDRPHDPLSLPAQRDALFAALRNHPDLDGVLTFPSRAIHHVNEYEPEGSPLRRDRTCGHRKVRLLMNAGDISAALRDGQAFSNEAYNKLGSGTFLLGLDDERLRKRQRTAAAEALRYDRSTVAQLAALAVAEAEPIWLRAPYFDLAQFAEQAALRFCSRLFGFATSDYPLLEKALRGAYLALTHQILGRHFVSDPAPVAAAREPMAALFARACELIDEYQRDPDEIPTGVDLRTDQVHGFEPAMRRLARVVREAGAVPEDDLSGEELGVIVVGVMSGVVGNVQAAVCSALHEFFRNGLVEPLRGRVRSSSTPLDELWPWIAEALRLNPPAAYLPRRVTQDVTLPGGVTLKRDEECVLSIVAALRAKGTAFIGSFDKEGCLKTPPPAEADPLIFGLDAGPTPHGLHSCIGNLLARPLISEIVRRVLLLRGLAEALDPEDGSVVGLERRWGFTCKRYPLSCRLDRQHALNVSMRVKTPIYVHAEALKAVIRAGAPRIERALRESRHIHFAWFEFIDNDNRLVLHTVFDGLFESYIEHFALAVGELFDRIFEHTEDAPPMPVNKYPGAFIDLIRRNDRPVAEGYFFSAYPSAEAEQIRRVLDIKP